MKRTLFALLLSPVCTNAQLLEVNLNAGANIHTFKDRDYELAMEAKVTATVGYAASVSATIKLPRNLRVGLAVSSYRIGYRQQYFTGITPEPAQRISMKPFLFEVLALSRNHFKKFNLDLGIVGGVCANASLKIKPVDGGRVVQNYSYKTIWASYGLAGSFQYSISKSLALGAEIQPKFISGDIPAVNRSVFVLPVSIKGTIRI